jgi:hypothetical protein
MEQSSSWEVNSFSARQEISRILWNPKVYYRSNTCPPPVPILSQLDPVHSPTSQFLEIHLNNIFESKPGSPNWSLSFRFPHLKPLYYSPIFHTHYMSRPPHFSQFYYLNILGEVYRSLGSSLCSFLHSPVTSFFLGSNIIFISYVL